MKPIVCFLIISLYLFSCQQTQQTQQSEDTGDTIVNEENVVAEYEGDTDATIIHTVAFSLMHEPGSPEARQFLDDGRKLLTSIPTVQQFEVRKETSAKNDFEYGFSMKFADQDAYDAYNEHPVHVDFVQNRWEKEVTDFMELDYIIID